MSIVCNMVGKAGSGAADVYAFIIVSYPAGSTCTASNGSTTLTAGDTSGTWVFKIPTPATTPETWTVTSTNGTFTATDTVSITTEGQSSALTLTYWNGEIFINGNTFDFITGGFTDFRVDDNSSYTKGTATYTTTINMTAGTSKSIGVGTVNKMDVTDFNTLTIKFSSNNFASGRLFLILNSTLTGITLNQTNKNCDYYAATTSASQATITLNVANVSGQYYVIVGGFGNYACAVSEWYLT